MITKLSVTFLVLNLLDYLLTVFLVSSGIGVEGNPVLSQLNMLGLGIVKVLGGFLVVLLFGRKKGMMSVLTGGMGGVVLWNMTLL
ncbi:hypothetical protein LCGC14_1146530 [marine sediment metagenome]|uniref:DUF5658 domain-containing protein n=1 Tax=marine sediment metagenome TaxID=412755 RepID=A0A0F9LWN2_9ZZZZ